MSDDKKQQDDSLRDSGLAFFGAITASVSHELNNVMAIMEQTTGLLEDRLTGSEDDIVITAEKLARIVTSLQNQSARGLEIIKRLNRFAHSADYPKQKFDVNETLKNLIGLSNRLAVLKGATLEAGLPDGPCEIESNPFYLQQAVFAAFRMVLEHAHKDDTLTISAAEAESRLEIVIEGPVGDADDAISDPAALIQVMESLSGNADIKRTPDRIVIRLDLPA